MLARSIANLAFVSAALVGALGCGTVSSTEEAVSDAPEAASARRETHVVTLLATQDARTQKADPDKNFGTGALWVNTVNHITYAQFDMLELPADARIESANLLLSFDGHYPQTNSVEVGQVLGPWDESTLTWNNQPAIDWNGPSTEIGDVAQDVAWDVTDMVRSFQDGSAENDGFGLRAPIPGGKEFYSKEYKNHPPQLVITYSVPVAPVGPFPDVGDAPDSTNHLGKTNTAYATGVPGNFPTVYQAPAGQAAGPLHENATLQALLGFGISAEREADIGLDADGPNNILHTTPSIVANVANRDRADDGWLNRNIRFYDCLEQTLTVRVTRPIGATEPQMFLNVWFDGDGSGAWDATGACTPPHGGPAQGSTEWIVQNYQVNMLPITPGSFVDLQVPTERVLNTTPDMLHWMRFTLSEVPAVVPPSGGQPDGRGPHPLSAQKSFKFGETEDYLHRPPPPGDLGQLVVENRVIGASDPEPFGGNVTYEVELTNVGGTGPAPAYFFDDLPFNFVPLKSDAVKVTSPGGATPLSAFVVVLYEGTSWSAPGLPKDSTVFWDGVLSPDSSVTLRFNGQLLPECSPSSQTTTTLVSTAKAGGTGTTEVSADTSLTAACFSPQTLPNGDPSSLPVSP